MVHSLVVFVLQITDGHISNKAECHNVISLFFRDCSTKKLELELKLSF